MGRRRLGVGRSAAGRVVRRNHRSAADRGTPADLHSATTDRARTSGDRSAADRGRPPAASSSSSRGNGPAAAYRRVARRGIATTGRGAATARDRCRRRTAARRLYAACLRALYRSSRSGFRDHRTGLVARRLHHRWLWHLRSNGGGNAFRPPGFCRRACGLPWPTGRPVPVGLGRRLAWRLGRPRLWRLAWRMGWPRLWRLAWRMGWPRLWWLAWRWG